jgi:hypothetical protein
LKKLKEKLQSYSLCKKDEDPRCDRQLKNLERCRWTRNDLRKSSREKKRRSLQLIGRSETKNCKKLKSWKLRRREIETEK